MRLRPSVPSPNHLVPRTIGGLVALEGVALTVAERPGLGPGLGHDQEPELKPSQEFAPEPSPASGLQENLVPGRQRLGRAAVSYPASGNGPARRLPGGRPARGGLDGQEGPND